MILLIANDSGFGGRAIEHPSVHSGAPVGTGWLPCSWVPWAARPQPLCPPQPASRRKRRVGDPALASQDAAGQGVPSRGGRPPEGRLLRVHPVQAPLLCHQHHRALCPHLRGHPHLLLSCQGYLVLVGGGLWPGQWHREWGGQNGTVTWVPGHPCGEGAAPRCGG